jgi:hypothetical protein
MPRVCQQLAAEAGEPTPITAVPLIHHACRRCCWTKDVASIVVVGILVLVELGVSALCSKSGLGFIGEGAKSHMRLTESAGHA